MFHRKGLHLIGLLACLALPLPALANDSDIVLLTLEWPPHTGSKLPDHGVVTKQVSDAYAAQGQQAQIAFFNWKRAIRLSYTDQRFTGVFPAYPSRERKRVCHLSEPIGFSHLGLAQRRRNPIAWKQVEDLGRYRLGTVDTYGNEDELDKLIQEKKQPVITSQDDAENLLNLAKGRVDGSVIDSRVFEWIMQNDARLRPYRSQLQMNGRLLVTWPLYVCFRKDAQGARQRDEFNAGLAKVLASPPAAPAAEPAPAPSPPATRKR